MGSSKMAKHMNVIGHAVNQHCFPIEILDDASHISEEVILDIRLNVGLAVMSAEDDVIEKAKVGVGHGQVPPGCIVPAGTLNTESVELLYPGLTSGAKIVLPLPGPDS